MFYSMLVLVSAVSLSAPTVYKGSAALPDFISLILLLEAGRIVCPSKVV